MTIDEYIIRFEMWLAEAEAFALTPEGQANLARGERIHARYNKWNDRIEQYLNSLSDEELDTVAVKFFARETKYEMWRYTHYNEQTTSDLLQRVTRIIEKNAVSSEPDEDFLSTMFTWRGYVFRLYCGQGCFWRIHKIDSDIYFQST